jgi:hypothetical protein
MPNMDLSSEKTRADYLSADAVIDKRVFAG